MRRGTTSETALAVIALAALVHLRVFQVVSAFVQAKTHGDPFTVPTGSPTLATFAKWGGGFTALAVILLVMEESPDFEGFGQVVGVTTATAAVIVALPELGSLFAPGATPAGAPVNYSTVPHHQ